MEFINHPKGTISNYTGNLLFQIVASESKQEHSAPVLHTSEGLVRLYIKGDNPFENNQLRAFEGQNIQVEGKWKNGILVVKADQLIVVPTPSNKE